MRVGIVGSRKYENKKKIKDFIFTLTEKYDDIIIVSGGCKDGADRYAKKYALELNTHYEEYPPAHHSHNLYCPLGEHNYGKSYHVSNYFKRNKQIAIHSDVVAAFIPDGIVSNGTMSTINYAKKMQKKTVILN